MPLPPAGPSVRCPNKPRLVSSGDPETGVISCPVSDEEHRTVGEGGARQGGKRNICSVPGLGRSPDPREHHIGHCPRRVRARTVAMRMRDQLRCAQLCVQCHLTFHHPPITPRSSRRGNSHQNPLGSPVQKRKLAQAEPQGLPQGQSQSAMPAPCESATGLSHRLPRGRPTCRTTLVITVDA